MNNEWKTAGEAIKTVEITHEIQLALKVIIADAIERQMNPKFDSINFRALTSWNEYQAGQDFTPDSPFRVCWCPQVPMQPYERSVESLALAGYAIEILAAYDLYLFEKKLKPDYTKRLDTSQWGAACLQAVVKKGRACMPGREWEAEVVPLDDRRVLV